MKNDSINDRAEAIKETDRFYEDYNSHRYSDEQVDRWLARWFTPFVTLKPGMRVLDLCCGDGCWSFGLLRLEPALDIVGYDISEGGVASAADRAQASGLTGSARFQTHDCATALPEAGDSFDLIFARGLFLFNQHDMMREGALELLAGWHGILRPGGKMISMYGTKYELMGEYTPQSETAGLPMNAYAEDTPYRVFEGGKFNHTIASFAAPFLAVPNAKMALFHYASGRLTAVTERV